MTITNSNYIIRVLRASTAHNCVKWYGYFGNYIAIYTNGLKRFITFDPVIIKKIIT